MKESQLIGGEEKEEGKGDSNRLSRTKGELEGGGGGREVRGRGERGG